MAVDEHTPARGRLLLALANRIREERDELARTESRNVGKPIREARDEVDLAADCFEYYAGTTNKITGQTIPGAAPGLLMSFREPVGVCGIIVPWNFPIAITSWKSRAGAGDGEHRRAQARRADADDRAAPGGAGPRRRPARRTCSRS